MQPLEKAHRTNLEEPELKIVHKDKWPMPLPSTNFLSEAGGQGTTTSANTMIDTTTSAGYVPKDKSGPQKASLFFGSSVPQLLIQKKPISFDLESCQYEVLEVQDYLYVHNFCKEHLLVVEEGQIKDKYTESEIRTLGWPVALAGDYAEQPFAMLRPIKNP